MNKKLLIIMVTLTLLGVISFIFFGSNYENFYESFLPNFYSDLFTGVIIVFFLSQYLPMIEKPNLQIIGKHFLDSTTKNSHKLAFSIKNSGNVNFPKEVVYWHIYIERNFVFRKSDQVYTIVMLGNEEYFLLSGSFQSPIYKERSNFLIDYDVFMQNCKKLKFLYYLSTNRGLFPETTNLSEDNQLIIGKKPNFCYIDIE